MKHLFIFILLICTFAQTTLDAAVIPDNNGDEAGSVSSSSQTIMDFMVPMGNDRILIVSSSHSSAIPGNDITSVTFNSQNLSQLFQSSITLNNLVIEVWYLLLGDGGPVTGDVVVDYSTAVSNVVGASSYQNVNQSSPFGGFFCQSIMAGATSSNLVFPVTHPGNMVIDHISRFNGGEYNMPGSEQTELWRLDIFSNYVASSYNAPNDGMAEMNWTWPTATNEGNHCAFELRCTPPVPMLSQWGLIILALCLVVLGMVWIRQEKSELSR